MRPHRLLAAALAISATALLVPASASAAETVDVLSMSAAREATRSVAWDVARRNGSVSSVKVGKCQRRAADRILCQAIDRGSNSTIKTTCAIRVDVTLSGSHPKGTLRGVNCENERLQVLRALQALEATQPFADEQVGDDAKVARVGIVGRVSRSEIKTMVGWIRPSAANPTADEVCALQFNVRLTESEEVTVQLTKSSCVIP